MEAGEAAASPALLSQDLTVGPPAHSAPGSGAIPRFRVLDGLRIFAALAVVIYHFTARENSAWGIPVGEVFPEFSRLSFFGAFGVQLFFVISGFVILLSAWGRSVGDFTASRIGRLFPAYWAGVILTSALLILLWPDGKDITATQSIVNLTMLQEPLGVGHVDGVYWTLWVELKFYILMGIFIWLGINQARILLVCALWPTAAVISEMTDSRLFAEMLMPEYAPFFAGGMLLFLMFREGATIPCWLLLGINVVLASQQTATGHFLSMQAATGTSFPAYVSWLAVASLFGLVAIATLTKVNRISLTGLSIAGALTFPLYLIHEHWGWWFISLLSPVLPHKVVLVTAITLCLAMAWAIWRVVELPLGPRLRRSVKEGLLRLLSASQGAPSAKTPSTHVSGPNLT